MKKGKILDLASLSHFSYKLKGVLSFM